jgi:glycosyltransferase involved in cell wall biosynthesis
MLTIVIPTYNRSVYLDYLLQKQVPICDKYKIPIIISNNASNDETRNVIKKWQSVYSLIKSHENPYTVSADENIEIALKLSQSKYTWLLGDSYFLPLETVEHVWHLVNNRKDIDVYVCNLGGRVLTPAKNYKDQNRLLSEIGSVMTCLSCLIFHKRLIDSACFEKYRETNFIQLGVILEYIDKKKFAISWLGDYSVFDIRISGVRKRNWSYGLRVMETGFRDWVNFVLLLPKSYLLRSKIECLTNFGKLSKLATLRGFLLMRLRGQLTNESYKEYKSEINLVSDVPRVIIRLISIFPKWPIKIACKIATKALNKKDLCL